MLVKKYRFFFPLILFFLCISCGPSPEEISNQTAVVWTSTPNVTPIPEEVRVLYDHDHTSNGLSLDTGGDVDTEVVTVGEAQEQAWRSGNGQLLPSPDGNTVEDYYMQFQVDDDLIFRGVPTSVVQIEIEYLDVGTDMFNIQYDAISGGPYRDGRFKESDFVIKTDSGEFKTAVFTLSDAYFANRDKGADFRIDDRGDGAETIRRVTVKLMPKSLEANLLPTETPLSPPEFLPDEQATVIFHNGAIITMEDGKIANAIAVKDERILDVGSGKDMLAYAGPETVLINLEGRTIMPGFVDTHAHILSNRRDDFIGAQDFILSVGITTYTEVSADEYIMREITALDREGELRLRISLYPVHVDNCGNVVGAWYLADYPVSREPGAMFQIPGVKMFNDGGSCNVPAVSFEYIGVSGHGDLYFSVEELTSMIVEAQNNGYQVVIHALGDRAIETNQDAIAAALAGGRNTYRHRIEHNTLLRDDLIPRYTEIDIVPLIFGYFPTCFVIGDSTQSKYVTPEEFKDWEWRWRPLIDANPDVHIAWHSDSPPMGPLDPIRHLYGFVTRKQVMDDGTVCEPPDWAADDVLTVEEALPLMTIEAAYAIFREDDVGSLRAGKYADLIILSENPLTIDPNSIINIEIWMTMVNGRVEFCAAGHAEVCP